MLASALKPSRLLSSLLRHAINASGPPSRSAVPFSNAVMNKLNPCHRTQTPIVLDFRSEVGLVAIQDWYTQMPTTRFTSLEYRKDRVGAFRHEFIVVRLGTHHLCRFDRRAREDRRAHALQDEGTLAEDTAHIIHSSEPEYSNIGQNSEVLLKIDVRSGEEINLILAVCCGIQTHPEAVSYSLLRYNCYFFSWTIVTAVTRYASYWEKAAAPEIWDSVVDASLHVLSPMPRQVKLSKREQIKAWFSNSGNGHNHPVIDMNQDESSRAHFRDELRLQLQEFRYLVADTLQKLLLQSQLAHELGKKMLQHSTVALLKARASAAQGSAASAAMKHVSDARLRPKEPEKYGELTWQQHCDIAWEVACEAANAAALAEEQKPTTTPGEGKVEDAGTDARTGKDGWDSIWDPYWRARIPSDSFNDYNEKLGDSASRHGREAWMEAWRIASQLRDRHLSDIAGNVARILIERLSKLETNQVGPAHKCWDTTDHMFPTRTSSCQETKIL